MTRATALRTLVTATCAACCAGTMAAHGGPPVTNGMDALQLEVSVEPATTAARARPRPVALELELRHTSTSGGPATPVETGRFDLPAGMNVNLERKPRCRLSALIVHRMRGCSKRSRVGSGSALLDGRPAGLGYPLAATVRVFSGIVDTPPPPPGFRPVRVLIIYAFAPNADVLLPVYSRRVDRTELLLQNSLTTIPVGVGVEEIKVRFRRMRWPKRAGGKPLIQAPKRCTGTWRFTAYIALVNVRLNPTDDVPCSRTG